MTEITTYSIYTELEENGEATRTNLANRLGVHKDNRTLRETLAEMVEEGEIEVDESGRYLVYSIASEGNPQMEEDEDYLDEELYEECDEELDEECDEETVDCSEVFNEVENVLPENDNGYIVERLRDGVVRVTTPDDNKIDMTVDERLLVINEEYHAIIKTPEQLLNNIANYANQMSIRFHTVRDVETGEGLTKNDISEYDMNKTIIFMRVERKNKAA